MTDITTSLESCTPAPHLIDEYRQAWVDARDEATVAYRDWCTAPDGHKRDAYGTYRAAADREDVAAATVALCAASRDCAAGPLSVDGRQHPATGHVSDLGIEPLQSTMPSGAT
jgi:hypothetical protein